MDSYRVPIVSLGERIAVPFFDRKCPSCGTVKLDSFEPSEPPVILCADCGEPTERAWLSKPANVIGDEMDHVQVNGLKTPRRFTSKIEHRRWLKSEGLRIVDDGKSKDAGRADTMDAQTLENARQLVSRASAGWRDPEHAPIGITSNDGIIRYLNDRRRAELRGEFGFSDR